MNEKPIVSIIVPVFNVEKYLEKCLDSLLNQTYKKIEIICINNGSTDKSGEILKQYSKIDDRIVIITQANQGVSVARNEGIKKAKGNYIMFVDSDDWIDKDTCKIAVETSISYNADIVMWSYIREFENTSRPKEIFSEDVKIFRDVQCQTQLQRRFIGLLGDELKKPENADALCPIWGKLYKYDIIKKNNIIFEDIRKLGTYEDGIFNLYYFKYIEKAVYINKYLYHYRKNNGMSLTTKYKKELPKQWENLFSVMREYIRENELPEAYNIALKNRIAMSILGLGLNILYSNLSFNQKRKELKKILSGELYRESYKKMKLSYFPLHWKFFYGCAKYNNAIGVLTILMMIQKIIYR